MPLTGTFLADFTSFTQASADAVTSLKSFETGAGSVEKALDRASNALTGVKIVQQATLAAEAIDRVGGVSQLTEAELAKVGAVATEAAAKLTAMGQDVPPKIQAIADAHKNVSVLQTEILGKLGDVAAAFGLAFSIDSAVRFLSTITEEAKALQILSAQTQINVEDLQVLGGATRQFGVSSEQLGRAIFQLGQRIAGGDASVVSGLALLGLSLDDVKGKHGEELFLMVETAAGKLTGTLRDTAMADLYGARLGSSLGALSTGITEAMDKARAMNTIMSADAVKAAADYAIAIERANSNLKAMATTLIGPMAEGFNTVAEAQQKGAGFWAIAAAMAKDFAASNTATGASTSNLADLLDKLNQKTEANAKATAGATDQQTKRVVAMTEEEQHAQFLATLQANASVALTAQQVTDLAHLKEIGELNAKNAEGIGVNAAQFAKYTASLEAAKKATEVLKAAQAEADALAMTGYTNRLKGLQEIEKAHVALGGDYRSQLAALQSLDAAEQALAKSTFDALTSEKDRAKVVADSVNQHIALMAQEQAVQLKQAGVVNDAILRELDASEKLNAEWGLNAMGAIRLQSTALDDLTRKLTALHLLKVDGISQAKEEQLLTDAYTAALDREGQAEDAVIQKLVSKTTETAAALEADRAAAAKADTAFEGYKNTIRLTASSLSDLNQQLTSFYDTLAARGPIGDLSGPSAIGTLAGPSAQAPRVITTPIQTRDAGGPVTAGTSYWIGVNKQPELFTPGASGFITPAGGGGTSIVNHIYVNGTAADVARQVANEILRTVKQGVQLS